MSTWYRPLRNFISVKNAHLATALRPALENTSLASSSADSKVFFAFSTWIPKTFALVDASCSKFSIFGTPPPPPFLFPPPPPLLRFLLPPGAPLITLSYKLMSSLSQKELGRAQETCQEHLNPTACNMSTRLAQHTTPNHILEFQGQWNLGTTSLPVIRRYKLLHTLHVFLSLG